MWDDLTTQGLFDTAWMASRALMDPWMTEDPWMGVTARQDGALGATAATDGPPMLSGCEAGQPASGSTIVSIQRHYKQKQDRLLSDQL